ncbi:hypothetical protein BC939DRAFT_495356 [Gamsiella multidivaricata]|uniref:uncharacterized protein n=1 Tax=Gamsiella multidivaricata TaxID=101098 RepID=UPI00221FFA50|nr:uncharacterized protein BC939DRAFT_495356 [Gamsiella multidivaricata]KAI7819198.1 hypothetical protein BC939DRAFT_495356 [Gamsiella multidivaricata]
MTQPHSSQQSQLPPEYRQALLEQQRQQQQQQQQQQGQGQQASAPTLQDIEQKHSQLPPQYRQAVLEKQQREQEQQRREHQQHLAPSILQQRQTPGRNQSVSLSSSPAAGATSSSKALAGAWGSTRQRNASAPLTGAYRKDRDNDSLSTTASTTGPGRAHWKPDSSTNVCTWPGCRLMFGLFDRRHHCRKCGDIFCSTHCSKGIPLDQALDFSPSEGVMSRACVGCFEAYEQWQGLVPSGRNPFTHVSEDMTQAIAGGSTKTGTASSSNHRPNLGRIPDGYLGGESTREAIGREDVVRQTTPASANIAIKKQSSTDQTVLPMPSVPHDWSWSTF